MDKGKLTICERMQSGEQIIGSFVLCHDASIVRVASVAGIHVLIIDYEHGLFSSELTSHFIDVAQNSKISVFVRCTMDDLHFLGGLLDRGLDGVIVAGARSAYDAKLIIDKLKFYPDGHRGINPFVPAADYGKVILSDFVRLSNNQTSVWVLAENKNLISELEEICTLPHLDGIFLGPYDLSFDLGYPGKVTHPSVMDSLNSAVRVIQSNKVSVGHRTCKNVVSKRSKVSCIWC